MSQTTPTGLRPEDVSPQLVAACTMVLLATFVVTKALLFTANGDEHRYPPRAPVGVVETVKSLSGPDFPWFLLRISRAFDTSVFRLAMPALPGMPMVVVVGDHAAAREVLTDPLSKKPSLFYKQFEFVTGGPCVFTNNGAFWQSRRKALAPAFSSNHVKRMNSVALAKTEAWIDEKLRPMIESGQSFDVSEEMLSITLSAICETAFEYDMSADEKSVFLSELDLALKEFTFKASTNPLRPMFGLFLPERRRAFLAGAKLKGIALRIMASYESRKSPMRDTIIDRIMKSDAYQNDDERAADIIVLLIGGHDTTAYSLAWTLLELSRNSSEQLRLREDLCQRPSVEWARSDVLKMAVKESMRLHPVAAGGSIRELGRDFRVKEKKTEMLIPTGSIVFLPFILFLRNPNVYEHSNAFRPSRWENPSKEEVDSFLPFSLGKQNCVGQSLANSELHCIIARLCAEFEFDLYEEGEVDYFLTLKPVGARLMARETQSKAAAFTKT